MKNAPLILSIIAVAAVAVFGTLSLTDKSESGKAQVTASSDSTAVSAAKGDIVYIVFDRIMTEYDMANDLRTSVETKVQNIQAEVDRRGKKLENDVNEFQDKLNRGLITRSVAEVRSQELQQQQNDFNLFAGQKQNEIAEEQTVMMNQIVDALNTYLEKYNQEKQYAMILINQGGQPVFLAQPELDITDDVLAGLNEEYVRNKNKK